MSQIKLSPNASGTGVFTIDAPNTNTDRTLSLPDVAGNIVTTGDTGTVSTSMIADSGITPAKLNGAQSGNAPIYGVRAWVAFNGEGTVAILNDGNVSSVTDNGTGRYTVNFETAMPHANYSISGVVQHNMDTGFISDGRENFFSLAKGVAPTTSGVRIVSIDNPNFNTATTSAVYEDPSRATVMIIC